MIRRIVKLLLGDNCYLKIKKLLSIDERRFIKSPCFEYYLHRLFRYSGIVVHNRNTSISDIIIRYHIVEKGLTMPNRRFGFGVEVILDLIDQINSFEEKYGRDEPQVVHAAGVIKAYWKFHVDNKVPENNDPYWDAVHRFVNDHEFVSVAEQPHTTREEFYKYRQSDFPTFAFSRHTLRHYSSRSLSIERIKSAVRIAATTPTACNRQQCRVYCVENKEIMQKLLAIQGGNRGFGHLADKLLIVTADLECIPEVREHADLYTNGGMFLMNLCYGLFYNEIAHCILNWSRTPDEDLAMRNLVPIKDSETVIAMLSCGETPDEFDVCSSEVVAKPSAADSPSGIAA